MAKKQRRKFWTKYIAQIHLADGTWKERMRNNDISRLSNGMQCTKWHSDGREWRIFDAATGKVLHHWNNEAAA